MLYFIDQDRSYLSEKIKIEGILRIFCLGDSMTYGQGCLITETLPFQLEKILNGVFWNEQVEVINAGICGYSIHDAWNRYINKFSDYESDLVVVTICDNDAELYNHRETTNKRELQMDYVEFSETCYDPEGEHFPYFRLLLNDISNYVNTQKIPVLIAFYDIHGGIHRNKIMPLIAEASQNSGLPFVDLSENFLDNASAIHNKLLKVSESDAHPSAIAHEIAARQLARFILKHNLLPELPEAIKSESEMIQNCLTRLEKMITYSIPPDKALFFFKRSLNAKRDSRLRLKLTDKNLLNDIDYQAILVPLNTTWQYFINLSVWQSYYSSLQADIEQFNFGIRITNLSLSRLAKTLFVLEKLLADSSLPVVYTLETIFNQHTKSEKQNFTALNEKLLQWKQQHLNIQSFAKETLDTLDKRKASFLPKRDKLLINRIEILGDKIKPFLNEIENILKTSEKYLTYYSKLAQELAQNNRKNLVKTLSRAYWLLDDTLISLDLYFKVLYYKNLSLPITPTSYFEMENCLTSVQVSLTAPERWKTSSNDEPLSIEIKVKSYAPHNYIITDIQTISQDGRPHLYCFQLSFFLDGEIWLGIKGGQKVQVNTVKIYNARDKFRILEQKDLTIENKGQIYHSPRIFVPI